MINVAWRELQSYRSTPHAWLLLAAVQFVIAWIFLVHFEVYLLQQSEMTLQGNDPGLSAFLLPRLFAPLSALVLFMAPLITARMVADELRLGTMNLLRSAPLSNAQIIGGKFLAATVLMSLMLLCATVMPLTLWLFTPIDFGALAAGLLGAWLCGVTGLATGLFFSTLTRHALSATASALAILLLLWLLGAETEDQVTALTGYLALPNHLQSFLRGLIDTRDIVYFALLSAVMLALGVHRLGRLEDVRG